MKSLVVLIILVCDLLLNSKDLLYIDIITYYKVYGLSK